MIPLSPPTISEFSEALRYAYDQEQSVQIGGCFSKNRMGGPLSSADVQLSTRELNRVIEYEPRDLTISVEAGMGWQQLTDLLTEHQQMLPLDPPLALESTVGGVVAANLSGPRRRLYGSARDMIIGMKMVLPTGEVVQSGGKVVKNVAGLDLQKMLIGSFGTLGAVASVNFKLFPLSPATRTFAISHGTLAEAVETRNRVMQGVLQPAALDLLNPAAAEYCGLSGYTVLIRAAGSDKVLTRYENELGGATVIGDEPEINLWNKVQNLAPDLLAAQDCVIIRVSHTPSALAEVWKCAPQIAWSRGATGITWFNVAGDQELAAAWGAIERGGWPAAIEWSPEGLGSNVDRWCNPGSDLDVMRQVKSLVDGKGLLNRGRLYGKL